MLRTWLRQLWQQMRGSRIRTQTVLRNPQSVRLAVEILEDRTLLAASLTGDVVAGSSVLAPVNIAPVAAVLPSSQLAIVNAASDLAAAAQPICDGLTSW